MRVHSSNGKTWIWIKPGCKTVGTLKFLEFLEGALSRL
jgi:hypothetical protein